MISLIASKKVLLVLVPVVVLSIAALAFRPGMASCDLAPNNVASVEYGSDEDPKRLEVASYDQLGTWSVMYSGSSGKRFISDVTLNPAKTFAKPLEFGGMTVSVGSPSKKTLTIKYPGSGKCQITPSF